jgi:hypothetical protein
MKLPIAAALIAAIALPAAASPGFDAFRKVCGDSNGDFTAIKAALGESGWAPSEILPTNMEGVTPTESIARSRTFGDQKVTIFSWIGMRGQFHLTACTARVTKLDLAPASQEAQAWVGFAPGSTENGKSTWRFGENGQAKAAVQKDGFQAAADGGGLFFFNLFSDHGETVLDLLKIKS